MKTLLAAAACAGAALLAGCQHDMGDGRTATTGSSASASTTSGSSNGLSKPAANTSGTPSAPSPTPPP